MAGRGDLRSEVVVIDNASKKYAKIGDELEKFAGKVKSADAKTVASTNTLTKSYYDNLTSIQKNKVQQKLWIAGQDQAKQSTEATKLTIAAATKKLNDLSKEENKATKAQNFLELSTRRQLRANNALIISNNKRMGLLKSTSASVRRSAGNTKKLAAATQALINKNKKLADTLEKKRREHKASTESIKKQRSATMEMGAAAGHATHKIKENTKRLAANEKALRKQAAALKRSKGMLGKFREGLVEISPVIARALTSPITAAAVVIGGLGYAMTRVISTASKFNEKIVRAGALATMTKGQIEELSKSVLAASAATEHTATTVTRAVEKLAIAGLELGQIQVALPRVLQLATVGAIDVEESVEALLGIVDQFGLPLTELSRVNDVLAYTSTNMRTTVGQLTEGFAKIGPVAKKYGMTIEDVASALAVMNARQIKGADAGTALRNMITRLIAPLASAKPAIRGVTDSLTDSEGKFIGMVELFERMGDKTNDASLMMDIFQRRTLVAAMASADAADRIKSLTAELKHAGGTAKRIADKQLSTFSGRMKIIKSVFEAMAVQIGSAMLPLLTSLANGFLAMLPSIQYVIGKLGRLVSIFTWLSTGPAQLLDHGLSAMNQVAYMGINKFMGAMNEIIDVYNAAAEKLNLTKIKPFAVLSDKDMIAQMKADHKEIHKSWSETRDKIADMGIGFDEMAEGSGKTKDTIKSLIKEMDNLANNPAINLSGGVGDEEAKRKAAEELKKRQEAFILSLTAQFAADAKYKDAKLDLEEAYIKKVEALEAERSKKLMANMKNNIQAAVNLGNAFVGAFVAAKAQNESFNMSMLKGLQAFTVMLFQQIAGRLTAYGVEAAAKAMVKESEKGLIGVGTGAIAGGLFISMIAGLLGNLGKGASAAKMNSGGIITGGSVGVDSVPALLSRGEMVLPKNVTDMILAIAGKPQQSGLPSRFAKGGIVADVPQSGGMGQNVSLNIQTLNIPSKGQTRRWIRDTLAPELKSLQRSNLISLA